MANAQFGEEEEFDLLTRLAFLTLFGWGKLLGTLGGDSGGATPGGLMENSWGAFAGQIKDSRTTLAGSREPFQHKATTREPQNNHRATIEQLQSNYRATTEQLQSNYSATTDRPQSSPSTSNHGATPELLQSNHRATAQQTAEPHQKQVQPNRNPNSDRSPHQAQSQPGAPRLRKLVTSTGRC